ncbi:MAG: acetoacetate--CoA ligase [Chloroflexaceae bacterium]
MAAIQEGTVLWEPSDALVHHSTMYAYMQWLNAHYGLSVDTYGQLWEWSVEHIADFWRSIWDFFEVEAAQPATEVLANHTMPGHRWFVGAELNYAQQVFRHATSDQPAILFQSELQPLVALSWAELEQQVASVAAGLREMGVQRGDRVVGYLPNIPAAVIAFLACAGIGAVWSSCSPDFGSPSVIDRFTQIEPKVLFAVDGYKYGGKSFARRSVIAELQQALPTLEQTILIPYLDPAATVDTLPNTRLWSSLLAVEATLTFEPVPFAHPLWVLYSSGTTGLPKPIVQGQGGILLEHLKSLSLHLDLKPGDRFFWFTTTGWMMWNFLVGGLLLGCTILLYDGSPAWPDMNVLWEFAAETKMSFFGTSAGYITACMQNELEPARRFDLRALRGVGSTGSPLSPEGFQWVYNHVRADLLLASISGGTDVCTAFVGGCPILPVHAGEIQCRCLGVKAEAFDAQGEPVIDEVGELVITEPMPSMPLFFWNDPGNQRYIESYFSLYPGIWRHGDWVKITARGSVVIYGRSDSTINRMGVRMGTSEIYRAVQTVPEVVQSLVIDLQVQGKDYMPLFVVLREDAVLDANLKTRMKAAIRQALSPRHIPDEIFTIPDVPRTLSGKILEVPVKKILMGIPVEKAANPDSMSNPQSLQYFVDLAARLNQAGKTEEA